MPAPVRPLKAARPRRAAAALLLTAIVAACGGAATPPPTPTPEPTEAPTPTPFDVAAAFLEIVSDPDFSARMEIDGTMEMGVTATMSGVITSAGDDSRTLLTIDVAGQSIDNESIAVGGKAYSRTGNGPWLEIEVDEPSAPPEETLNEFLAQLEEIEDLGVVTKNGKQLHHLSIGDLAVPPSALGLDPKEFTDPEIFIEFYAEDDGTPAVFTMEGSWGQLVAGQTFQVEFVMDLDISNVGSPISISAPTEVWTTYSDSPLAYTVAIPPDVTVENREELDVFVIDGFEWFYVASWPEAAGLNNEGFLAEMQAIVSEDWGTQSGEPIPAILGGEPAYLTTYTFTYDDNSPGIAFDVTSMHANVGWEVGLNSDPTLIEEDGTIFDMFLATFAFTE